MISPFDNHVLVLHIEVVIDLGQIAPLVSAGTITAIERTPASAFSLAHLKQDRI